MLVTSSRPTMGPLTSSASSPTSHHVHQHHPADLSPRSSNSSLMSSNESLLNTSLSMPSPGARENVISPRGSAVGLGEVSPLQCLQNAFSNGRSTFSLFHEGDNEQLEQQIKSFGMMASPVAGDSPGMKCESDEEMNDHDHDEHAMARTPSGSPGSTSNGINNIHNGQSTIFQCPLCTIICNSRHDFNEHLVTHSAQHACPRCEYIAGTEEELRDHAQETHGVDDFMEIMSDDEAKTPKTNAQGKLKTFKCKHCEYRAVTKKEFWDHTKSHIREDKMLHCPKCPFITEYKHHLEYHLRNHMNSKPYQCGKCPYSCVNKSMLNSHLKSHSNVYQYRCSDCSYATKYCHSLKLHLRKYNHNPAMVLNPDGTPNPLPIIDVYGTRRGPKIKRPDPILEGLATTTPALPCSPNHINNNNNNKPVKAPKKLSTPVRKEKATKPRQPRHEPKDLSPKLASSPRYISSMPGQVVTPPLKKMKEDSSGDSDSDIRLQSSKAYFQSMGGRATQLPQAPISPSSIAMILQQTNNGLSEHHSRKEANFPLCSPPNTLQQIYSAAVNQYLMNPALNGTASLNDLAKQMSNDQQAKMLAQFLQSRLLYTQQWQQQHMPSNLRANDHELNGNDNSNPSHCPLDLRNPKNDGMMMAANDEIKRRKRKGKASRYERVCSSEDEDEALDFSYNNNNNNNNEYKENKKRKHDSPTDLSVPLNNLLCKYCEINFPDRELYAIHMNFHSGDVEPFLCRSCGKKTRDKVEFSRHLFTDPH